MAASFEVTFALILSLPFAFFLIFSLLFADLDLPGLRVPSFEQAEPREALPLTERQTLDLDASAPPVFSTRTLTFADLPALTFFGTDNFATLSFGALTT